MKSKSLVVRLLLPFRKLTVSIWSLLPRGFSSFMWKLFRNNQFIIGFIVRYLCLAKLAKSCGEKVIVFPNVYIKNPNSIDFGTNISIHENSYIDGYGGLSIGNDVAISHNCSIVTFDHAIDAHWPSVKNAPPISSPVKIGNDVWLGAGCRVLKGVSIEDHCVVGAGSVLTKSTLPWGIYAGVPATLKRLRIEEDENIAVLSDRENLAP